MIYRDQAHGWSTANAHSVDPRKHCAILPATLRYTHRVAISNRRQVVLNDKGVTFKWKDYRLEGRERYAVMMLDTHEFIRRFLMHLLPQGFHRIPCYGLLTSPTRANNITRIGALLTDPLIPIAAIKPPPQSPKSPNRQSDACASSRPSCRGNSPDGCPTHLRPRSGSIPHDDDLRAIAPKSRPLSGRSSAGHGSARFDAPFPHATAPPVSTDSLDRRSQEPLPPTCIAGLTAQLPLAADLSQWPPTAKCP
jgi:hypothetical protein